MKDICFGILRPLLTAAALLRYSSIWGLKRYLQTHKRGLWAKLMRLTYGHYFLQRGSFIGIDSEFAGTPCFPHGVQGIFISNQAKIGRDVVLFQQVTIGSNTLPDSKTPGSPTIGDCAYIGAGAKIIGGVTVGDHCRVGANAVVYEDMEPHSVAVCAATRILQKERLDNTFTANLDGVDYYFRDGALHPGKPPARETVTTRN